MEYIRNNCRKIPQEHQAIDEQIIPTKSRIAIKQYNPQKPHKWGYKVVSRAGASGFIYDFELYTGKGTVGCPDGIGVSSAFVLRLAENISKHKNYKLFYDNWFSSLALSAELEKRNTMSVNSLEK